MNEEELWGTGKLSIKSVGIWPENALADLNNARILISEYGFDIRKPVDLGSSEAVMHSLNGIVPNTAVTWRRFFEENDLAYCYVIDGLTERSALVSSSKWEETFLSIKRPHIIVCEITDIDRRFRKPSPEFMADMKTLYNGIVKIKTGINPDELNDVNLAEYR